MILIDVILGIITRFTRIQPLSDRMKCSKTRLKQTDFTWSVGIGVVNRD